MIATARVRRPQASTCWNDRFLELLPVIRDQAQFAFRRLPLDAREELIQEAVSQAYFLFVRLVQRVQNGSRLRYSACSVRDPEGQGGSTPWLALQSARSYVSLCRVLEEDLAEAAGSD
jgi:hypothetical protein